MFEHIDYINMPIERLKKRGLELADLDSIPRSGENYRRIQTEMAMICFELVIRENQIEELIAGEDIELEL